MRKFIFKIFTLISILTLSLNVIVACGSSNQSTVHTHDFSNQTIDTKFLKTQASSNSAAEYYYSCDCGEIGVETFNKIVIPEGSTYVKIDNFVYFGRYPQTLKSEDVKVSEEPNENGYYIGDDNEEYAKIVADPYQSGYKFSDSKIVEKGKTYYFKVEPLRWKILNEDENKVTLVCDNIISNNRFNDSSNLRLELDEETTIRINSNYERSEIRNWLNSNFYNTAFNEAEKEVIAVTSVDNSPSTTGFSTNVYAFGTTEDNVYLLSYEEVNKIPVEFKKVLTTDYSRAIGVYMSTNENYYGNGCWWLRSPYNMIGIDVLHVDEDGSNDDKNFVFLNYYGVVPALQINIQ